jgi:hypothetical protein
VRGEERGGEKKRRARLLVFPAETKKNGEHLSLSLSTPCFSILTFAAGCSTSSSLRIVAPSLVMVTSPMSSTSI